MRTGESVDSYIRWTCPDGVEYHVVVEQRQRLDQGRRVSEEQCVIMFTGPDRETLTAQYSGTRTLHEQPEHEIRAYLNVAKHRPDLFWVPVRPDWLKPD